MFEDVDIGTDADVAFTVVEALGDATYRVEGSFTAPLTNQASLGDPLDEGGDVLDVDGTFTVESLPRREVEEVLCHLPRARGRYPYRCLDAYSVAAGPSAPLAAVATRK